MEAVLANLQALIIYKLNESIDLWLLNFLFAFIKQNKNEYYLVNCSYYW